MWWQFVIALSFEAILIFLALVIGFALGSSKDKKDEPQETVTERTMFVVQDILLEHMDGEQVQHAIGELQREGILFREAVKK